MELIKNIKNVISKEIAVIIGGALFIALLSKIAMFLPFTPVPVTMQTLATLLVAAALGKKGALSVITYIAMGLMGLPVLNVGLLTGGYLIGFVIAAYLIGYLFESKIVNNIYTAFIAFCGGELIILTTGSLWLMMFTEHAFAAGFFPFLLGGLFKVCLATFITKKIKKW